MRLSTASPMRPAARTPTFIPSTSYDLATASAMFHPPLMTVVLRDVVTHKRQDHHDSVFRNTDAITKGNLAYRYVVVDRGLQIDVVRADPGRDSQFEVRRLRNPFGCNVRGPKWLRNYNISINYFLLEYRIRTVLVRRYDKRVTTIFQKFTQTKLS